MNENITNLFKFITTIFLSLSIIFFAVRLAPGDPVERILGPKATQEERVLYEKQLGLDKGVFEQYGSFLKNSLQFNFGESLFKKKEVSVLIKEHFPPSFLLAFISIFLSFFVGSFLGVISARKKGSFWDVFLRIFSLFGLSFPIFALAPLLVLVFSISLGLFPVSEWGSIEHIFLPALTLIIPLSTILMRITRNRFLDDFNEPYVQVLRAKGLSDKQIIWRVFKNTLPTILNVVAIQLSVVLAGTIITETIYDIPGMGLLLFESIENRDYPVIQGVVAFITIIYMTIYFVFEWLNQKIDPRIVK